MKHLPMFFRCWKRIPRSSAGFGLRAGRWLRDSGGFTLVEVVLAIGVAAVALVGIFALLQSGLKTYQEAMNSSITIAISQEVISQYLLADFDKIASLPPQTNYYDAQGLALETAEADDAIYQCVARSLPGTVQGIDRSKLLPFQVTITSPVRPGWDQVYTFFLARQGEDSP